jgi:hypothetical protein
VDGSAACGHFFLLTRSRVHPEGGVEVLEAWLDDSAPRPERRRGVFLVCVLFGDPLGSAWIEVLLDSYEHGTRSRRDRLTVLVSRLAERPRSTFRRAAAVFGAAPAQTKLDWVEHVSPFPLGAGSAGPSRC